MSLIVLAVASGCSAPIPATATGTATPSGTAIAIPTATATSRPRPTTTQTATHTPTPIPSATARPSVRLVEVPLSPPLTIADEISDIAWSPDGAAFVATSSEGIHIYSTNEGKQTGMIPVDGGVNSAAFDPDGSRIYALVHRRVAIWDAHTGQMIGTTSEADEAFSPALGHVAAISPDGRYFATGGTLPLRAANTVVQMLGVWDLTTGDFVRELFGNELDWALVDIAFSPDGKQLATGSTTAFSDEVQTRLWSTATWTFSHTLPGNSVAMSPDGTLLATSNHGVHIWNALALEPVTTLEMTGDSLSFNFRSDLLTLSANDGLHIWDAESWELLFENSDPLAYKLEFSPTDNLLLATGFLGPVRLWRIIH